MSTNSRNQPYAELSEFDDNQLILRYWSFGKRSMWKDVLAVQALCVFLAAVTLLGVNYFAVNKGIIPSITDPRLIGLDIAGLGMAIILPILKFLPLEKDYQSTSIVRFKSNTHTKEVITQTNITYQDALLDLSKEVLEKYMLLSAYGNGWGKLLEKQRIAQEDILGYLDTTQRAMESQIA